MMQQQHQQPVGVYPQAPMQYTNPQHLQPPMMLYPVQYVYDPQMMMPGQAVKPDEHVQPNQAFQNPTYLINVQNPPPWIQNRTNMVYMPQMQMNNLQPYIPQNMVQNPMINYQYQPMIMQQDKYQPMIMQQDIRHTMMPNIVNQNLVQNLQRTQNTAQYPQRIIQNTQNFVQNTQNTIQNSVRFQSENKQHLPILTQMLQSQPKVAQNQQNAVVAPIHMTRPQFQSVRPQMLTVNPMSSNHTCVHHKLRFQKEPIPLKNEMPHQDETLETHEVPQSIRNQIPEGLSVKTVYKVPKTAMVRPNEYANIAPAALKLGPKPMMKNSTTNTEPLTNNKRKIQDVSEQDVKDSGVQTAKRNCEVRQDLANKVRYRVENNIKQINTFAGKHNLIGKAPLLIEGPLIVQNNQVNEMPQREDKLLRNTVYVQARGIINETPPNEMEVACNTSNQHSGINATHVNEIKKINNKNPTSLEVIESFQNKIKTVKNVNELPLNEMKNNNKSNHNTTVNELLQNNMNNKSNHNNGLIESLRNELKNVNTTRYLNTGTNGLVLNETNNKNNTNTDSIGASETLLNEINNTNNESNQNTIGKKFNVPINNEVKTERILAAQVVPPVVVQERENTRFAKNINKRNHKNVTSPVYNDCVTKTRNKSKIIRSFEKRKKAEMEEIVTADVYKKEPIKKFVLTHVLDGHIIQESNVPFQVQKPSISPIKKTQNNNMLELTELSKINKEESEKPLIKIKDAGPANSTQETNIFSNKNEVEMAENNNMRDSETYNKETLDKNPEQNSATIDCANMNEEHPFQNIDTATIKSWTVSELFDHLNNPSWIETALKLREEEIDGESLLLVNNEQLLQIGISENHTQILSEYIEKVEAQ